MEKLIELAYASSAHGIKGAVQLNLHNIENSILQAGMEVWLLPAAANSALPTDGLMATIESIQFGNKTIATFHQIKDRTAIEQWLPFTLSVSRDQFPEEDQEEIYLADLMGLEVFNPAGKRVGVISGTFNHGSVDVIVIELKNGEELTLPFISDFFPTIDLEAKRVVISDVEYL